MRTRVATGTEPMRRGISSPPRSGGEVGWGGRVIAKWTPHPDPPPASRGEGDRRPLAPASPAARLGALAARTLLGRRSHREGREDARHVLAPAGRALDLLGLRADELLERLLAVGAAILVDRHGAQSSRACDA